MTFTYKGMEIRLSRTADREMVDKRVYMADVLKILNEGSGASRSRRRKGIVEKVAKVRGRTIKVVAVESVTRWNGETVWLVVHVGDTRER